LGSGKATEANTGNNLRISYGQKGEEDEKEEDGGILPDITELVMQYVVKYNLLLWYEYLNS
jgi:hypothetical protein